MNRILVNHRTERRRPTAVRPENGLCGSENSMRRMLFYFLACAAAVLTARGADVVTLVHQPEGNFPYKQLAALSSEDVQKLTAMLSDEREAPWRAHIVLALGVSGAPEAFTALKSLLEDRPAGEVDQPTYAAMTNVPIALGHLAARTNADAEEYLIRNVRRGGWMSQSANWTYLGRPGSELKATNFYAAFIYGLGVASTPACERALKELGSDRESGKVWLPVVGGAYMISMLINSEGREKHFGGAAVVLPLAGLDEAEVVESAGRGYSEITNIVLGKGFSEAVPRLAELGIPLSDNRPGKEPGHVISGRSLVMSARTRYARAPQLVQQQLAILAELQQAQCTRGDAVVEGAGTTSAKVTWPWLGSEAIVKKYGVTNAPGGPATVDTDGRLVLHMIFKRGTWFWNPYGW
jgi:hypothetical protein